MRDASKFRGYINKNRIEHREGDERYIECIMPIGCSNFTSLNMHEPVSIVFNINAQTFVKDVTR